MRIKKEIFLRRRVNKLSATFFAIVLVLCACEKEETTIGADFQEGNLNVIVQDTFTIKTYSDEILEMDGDEASIALLGAYNDPVFGGVNCGVVTQIVPNDLGPDFTNLGAYTMDSVVLALRYSSINYYANLDDIIVEVFEIDDVLAREDDYFTSQTPTLVDASNNMVLNEGAEIPVDWVSNSVVGSDTLAPQLRVRLDTEVGVDLIADALANNMGVDFQTTTFKGIYIRVDADDDAPGFGIPPGLGTVLYFSMEDILSKMTIYYTRGDGVAEKYDFKIDVSTARYNKIDYERAGTSVEAGLADQSLGQEIFYMQGGAVRGIIEFPFLQDFYTNDAGEFQPKIINKAELILPIQDFAPDPFNPTFRLFIARVVDEKLSDFTLDYNFGTTLAGNTIEYDQVNKEYRFIMTQEVQALLNGDVEHTGYRLYSPGFFASTIERIVFNGPNSGFKDKPRLEITYTEY
jgi:hypothetical protein